MMHRNQSAHCDPLLVARELAPQHKGYLAARAVPLEIAKLARLVSVTKHEADKLLGFGGDNGLWIPYPGPDDFGRLRLDEPFTNKKGKPTRYLTPKEEVRPYLSWIIPEKDWQDTSKPLYIVESAIKALALIAVDLLAIGLAGVRTGHQKGADVSRLHDLILAQVKLLKRRVVILLDAGKATNKDVLAADKKQAELYAQAGANVFVATLPLTEEGKDQGPDDFLCKHGVEALRAVLLAAKPLAEAYPPEEKGPKKTQAHLVVELMQATGAPIWIDNQGVFWLTFQVDQHLEHHRLRSEAARRYIRQLTHEKAGIIPGAQSVQDAIATLEAITPRAEPFPVFVRVGESYGGKLYLDLGSVDWSAVEIDSEGWRLVNVPPIRFRRSKGMLALPTPVKGGDLAELRSFLNTPQETEWRFLVAWVLAALRAKGPYPIGILQGEEGSAKSTTARILRALIDPNVSPIRSTPHQEQDLVLAAFNGWVLGYDNMSGVSVELSDSFCRAATGAGFSTRSLYSNNEEELFWLENPILLNGIDAITTRSDLSSRALLVTLQRIEEENRRQESDVWRRFEEARPRILGALLDVVSAGLKKLPSIKPKRLPRMADFAKWILACEESLGWEAGSFLVAYFASINEMAETAIEGDLFSRAVVELIQEKTEWKGSASELLAALNLRVEESARRVKGWPQDATRTSNKLRRVSPSLVRLGFKVRLDDREGHKGRRILFLGKADAADAVPPPSQLERNREEKREGTEKPTVRTSPKTSVSSVTASATQTVSGVAADAVLTLEPSYLPSVSTASAQRQHANQRYQSTSAISDAADAADAENSIQSKEVPKETESPFLPTNPPSGKEALSEFEGFTQHEREVFFGSRAHLLTEGHTPELAEQKAVDAILHHRRRSD